MLPGILVFATGLTLTVAPLTTTALSSVTSQLAGIASGVNNAVARTGSLVAVAGIPVIAGFTAGEAVDDATLLDGYDKRAVGECRGRRGRGDRVGERGSARIEPEAEPPFHCARPPARQCPSPPTDDSGHTCPMRISVEPSTDPADYPFRHRIRVRFAETDAMQIVHHGRYLPYLEEGRVAYLRHIGHPYTEWRRQGTDSAVLEAYVRYVKPLRFDDEFDVHIDLADVTRTTFQMSYLLTRGDRRVRHRSNGARPAQRRRPADPPAGLAGRARLTERSQNCATCLSVTSEGAPIGVGPEQRRGLESTHRRVGRRLQRRGHVGGGPRPAP